MFNDMHGLCTDCLAKCDQSENCQSKEDECFYCNENKPDLIFDGEGICLKCYLKNVSPNKKDRSVLNRSIEPSSPLPIKLSFLNSSGNMVKKIEKLMKRDDILKYLGKNCIESGHILWEKMAKVCDKTASLVYIFVTKNHILGAFHKQSLRIGETLQDQDSGCFITNRQKIDLRFYHSKRNDVTYDNKKHVISFGFPTIFDIVFENVIKIRTELIPESDWIYFFIYK